MYLTSTYAKVKTNSINNEQKTNDITLSAQFNSKSFTSNIPPLINTPLLNWANENIKQIDANTTKQRNPDKIIESCPSKPASTPRNNKTFSTMDATGIQAIRDINPTSIQQYREYGGSICEKDGEFSYSHPNIGVAGCVQGSSCPSGSKRVGDYHTHGGPTKRYNVEDFSQQDWLSNEFEQITGYLGTPSGAIKKYTPAWDIHDDQLYPTKTETIGYGAK